MFRILLPFIIFVSTTNLFAQLDQEPDWMSPNRSHNFYDIQEDFSEYWQGKRITPQTPRDQRPGWKQFKRWEWFWEQRVYPTGEFPKVGHVYNEYLKYKNSSKKKTNDKTQASNGWSHLGPTTASGGYTGIGRLNCVIEDPNYNGSTNKTIWVGAAAGGIWKTTDGGDNWSTNTDDLAVLGIGDLAIDPDNANIMYAATGDGDGKDTYSVGVLKSTDGGDTWNTTGFSRVITEQEVCRRMIISHDDSDVLFVATNEGLYRTSDAGSSWIEEITGNFYDVKMHPTNSSIVYAVKGNTFYRSTDGGANWSSVSSGLPSSSSRFALAVSPDESDYVYVLSTNSSGGFNGLYRSTNAGLNFSTRSTSPNILSSNTSGSGTSGQGWYDLAIAVNPDDGEEVHVGGINIWKSTNGGANWTLKTYWYNLSGYDEVHADHHMLYYPDNGRLYTANDGGLDISTDNGSDYDYIGSGIHITQFYEISVSQTDEDEVLCGAQDNSSFLKTSSSFGMTRATGDGMDQAINPSNGNTMFTASYFGNISRSYNGGASWSGIPRPEAGAWVTPYVIDPNNNSTLIAGYVSVWKSTNNGTNWSDISNFSNENKLTTIHVAKANSDYIYTGRWGAMWYTSNGGTSWNTITLPNNSLTSITTNHSNPEEVWICVSGYSSGNKVYHSTNAGSTWTNISGTLPNVPCNSVLYQPNTDDRVWVGTDIGVWYRGDDDSDWVEYNEDLPNVICNDLEIYVAGDKLRVGTYGRGLWEVDLPSSANTPPDLTTPANNSLQVNLDADLEWEDLTNEDSYDLQVSKLLDFSTTVVNKTGLTNNTYDLGQESLDSNTKYYWRVRAIIDGDPTYWTTIWNFKTYGLQPPTLTSPASSATDISRNVMFEWDAEAGATGYNIQFSNQSNFSTTIFDEETTNTSFYKSGLDFESTYYWRVRSKKDQNYSDWSDSRMFNTEEDLAYCFKLEESFESTSIPDGWTTNYSVGTTDWQYGVSGGEEAHPSSAQEGYKNALFFRESRTMNATKLITPLITLGDCSDTLTLEFWHTQEIWGPDLDSLYIYYQLDGNDTWVFLAKYTSSVATWTKREINISQISDDFKIAFEAYGAWGYGACIDNVAIYAKPPQYCDASTTEEDEYITNVNFGDINKSSGYQDEVADFTANSTDLTLGETAEIIISTNLVYNGDDVGVWCDWDQSYEFDQNDEFFDLTYDADLNKFKGNITVPNDALLGDTRMRVRIQWLNGDQLTPCGSKQYGEIEDYTLNINLPAPQLVSPSNSATNQNINLTFDWNSANGASSYIFQISESNTFASTIVDINTSETEKEVSNLDYNTTYYWRVQSVNGSELSEWSEVWSLSTKLQLFKPDLVSPANNSTNQEFNLTFDWNSTTNATTYDLQVSTSDDFSSTVYDINTSNTEFDATGLNPNTTFYWRVRSDNNGDKSEWSDIWDFTTKLDLNPPNLVSPANNSSDQQFDLTLDWNTAINATSYDVQVSTTDDFTTTIVDENTANTEKSLTGLNEETTYYWRVRSKNGGQMSDWSNVWQFTTKTSLLPPSLSSPANGAVNREFELTLGWNPVTGATGYDVQVDENIAFNTTILNVNVASTEKTISNLGYQTTYYWRVRSTNALGESQWSTIRSFTTKPQLSSPTLIIPIDGALDMATSVIYQWNSVSGASSYQIQVSENQLFTTTFLDVTQSGTFKMVNGLSEGTQYYWRVKAFSVDDESQWSTIREFTTEINIAAPDLVDPTDGETDLETSLTLDWNSVTNATSYDIQLSENSNFSTTLIDENLTDTERNVLNLDNNVNYFWRVRAKINSSEGPWSDIWEFTTKPMLLPPDLVSPADDAVNQSTDLTMDWNPSTGAASYDIQLSTDPNFNTTIIDDNIIPTEKTIAGLSYNTVHYWKVRARNGANVSVWSNVFEFTTYPALTAPSLVSPTNNSIDQPINITLEWNSISDADNYELQLSDINDFSNIVHSATIATTSENVNALNVTTKYYWRVRAKRTGEDGPWSSEWNFTTTDQAYIDVPDDWDFVTTSNSHSLIVPVAINPQVAGRSFQNGDAIGAFFDDNGVRKCAGYELWDGNNLGFSFFGDDDQTPEKDGFANSEDLFFKIWDAQDGKVYDADFTIESGPSTFINNGLTTLASLNSATTGQDIDLMQGWNMISSYVTPDNQDMADVFSNITANILIVKNGFGKLYVPQYNINTIGNWNLHHGYQVYATQNTTLSIMGNAATPENEPIYPSTGWNMLSYLRNSAMSCIPAMESLTDRDNLLIMKNANGKLYVPQYSINTIGDMQPGDGYQMYITNTDTLKYPANGTPKMGIFDFDPSATNLLPVKDRTGSEMTLLLQADVPTGTEAGVYNSEGELIGSGSFNDGITGITIWGDDEYTIEKDGASKSEQLTIKLLINNKLIEKELDIVDETGKMLYNQLTFEKGSIVSGNLDTKDINFDKVYLRPQPASDKMVVELFDIEGDKTIEIRSLDGKLLNTINTSHNLLDLDISKLSNGTYILTIQSDQGSFTKRFIKMK